MATEGQRSPWRFFEYQTRSLFLGATDEDIEVKVLVAMRV